MKTSIKYLLTAVFGAAAFVTNVNGGVADGNNRFALEALAALHGEADDENFAFSPFSIVNAFAMAHAGARGETATQMEEFFGFSGLDTTPAAVGDWSAIVEAATGDDTEFRLANRTWFQEGWPVEEPFLQILDEFYGAPAGRADFVSQFEAERIGINDWVFQETSERIADLFPEGALNEYTRFVLVNALYFRAPWEYPFDPGNTFDGAFQVGPDETIQVRMMSGIHPVRYFETDAAEAIALQLEEGGFSLLIVLPEVGGEPIAVIEEMIAGSFPLKVSEWTAPMGDREILLPRFRVDGDLDLKEFLPTLGLTDPFVPHLADFSGIYIGPEPELHISAAHHKAFVEVTESGVEAAAATGLAGGVTSVPPRFEVDRPFLLFLAEDSTGTILFAGQVVRPENPTEYRTGGFEAWLSAHFDETDRFDRSVTGPQAAPMGDSVPNLLKYALGKRPTDSARDALPRPVITNETEGVSLALEFVGAQGAEVDFVLEASSDLQEWEEVGSRLQTVESLEDGRARLRLVADDPGEEASVAAFVRLRVRFPEK